jgi:hypothetical protein
VERIIRELHEHPPEPLHPDTAPQTTPDDHDDHD